MFQVYLKELLELTRDKKTLIFTILLPTLIMPLIMIGFMTLAAKIATKAKVETLNFAIVGSQYLPEVENVLTREKDEDGDDINFKLVNLSASDDVDTMINEGKIRFAIIIPEDVTTSIEQGLSAKVSFKYNDSATTSALIYSRVQNALKPLKDSLLAERYRSLGLTEEQGKAFSKPIDLEKISTADKRESFGEKFGAFLPYILILVGLSGAMYPAIDLGVGEKERGTLETLLLTPVSRFNLVFSKFAVIFTTSFLAVFLSLLSFALVTGVLGPMFIANLGSSASKGASEVMAALANVSIIDVLLMFSMLIPVAAIFASLMLSVSIYARTFKEAQNYMSPIMMVAIFPLILAMLPGVKLDWVWASVPITNVALAIKEIFKGTIDLGMMGVIFLSTTIIAGLLLALCNWWFQREQVLFRN
ncbi:ABC transporter permease [Aliikangiella sp. G2MR2-5]|uniref:ABC transporter permease n=1 Tax=Aliikangiella sp. G2MR2-5 TaxID=2788943 RepID=UPI0018AB0F22|nr:ABC transporter permease [Aliikangiella sp. G2MR2-5]